MVNDTKDFFGESHPPRISVVMAVYNGERFLRQAIDSVLSQSFSNFEFIIVDDGSTDGSVNLIFAYDDRRIRLLRNPSNMGLAASLNNGIFAASGEYIARMDDDDVCLPGRFAEQVSYLDENPSVDLCFTHAKRIDIEGKELPSWKDDQDSLSDRQIKMNLRKGNCLFHPTVMFRSECIKANGYDASLRYGEDYELWLRLAALGYVFGKVPAILLNYRVRGSSMTGQRKGDRMSVLEKSLLIREHALRNYMKKTRRFGGWLWFLVQSYRFRVFRKKLKAFLGF